MTWARALVPAVGVAGGILFACVGQDPILLPPGTTNGNDASGTDDVTGNPPQSDAGPGAGNSGGQTCSLSMPFVKVTPLGANINTVTNAEYAASLTADEKTIVFSRYDGQSSQLYMATRASAGDDFGLPSPIVLPCSPACSNDDARLSASGDSIVFTSDRNGGVWQIYSAQSVGGSFSNVNLLYSFSDSSASYDSDFPFLMSEEELFFSSYRGTNQSYLYRATKTLSGTFSPAQVNALAASNGPSDRAPVLNQDGLTMYFASTYPNPAKDDNDLYHVFVMQRPTLNDSFGPPASVSALQSLTLNSLEEDANWLSDDGCRLYFESYQKSGKGGQYDIYVASKL